MTGQAHERSAWNYLQGVALSAACGEGLLLAALPLLAVTLTADPQGVSLVTVASQLPWIALPLAVGVVIDRFRKTTLLRLALGLQVLAGAVLVLCAAGGLLSIPGLMAVAFVLVVGQVVAEGTRGALVPAVVGLSRLEHANSRLLAIDLGVVRFLVPPVAGFAVAYSSVAVGWIVTASMLAALVLSFGLRVTGAAPPTANGRVMPLVAVKEGLRYLLGSGLLRSITVAVSVAAFAWFMGYAVFVLYVEASLGLGARGYGLLLACTAVGFAVAALVASRIIARFRYPIVMRVAVGTDIACKLALGVVPGHWAWVAIVLCVHSFATFVWNVSSQSCRQRFTPTRLLGRVLTSHRALSWGVAPLGAAFGGLVAAAWGPKVVWLVGGAIQLAGVALVWRMISPAGFAAAERDLAAAHASEGGADRG